MHKKKRRRDYRGEEQKPLFFVEVNSIKKVGDKIGNNIGEKPVITRKHGLNLTRERILSEMRHNPNITKSELVILIGISDTAIDNNIRYLRNN